MSKSFLTLFWITLLLHSACDKVVEKPEVDTFPDKPLMEMRMNTDDKGEVAFDVVTENEIKEAVSVQFSTPAKGFLSPDPAHHRFIYRAFSEESGTDSFSYTISKPGITRKGNIFLAVKTPPCKPVYSGNVDYNIGNRVMDTALFIPFDLRDTILCRFKQIEITGESPLFRISSISSTGFYVKPIGSFAGSGSFSINYKITVHELSPFPKLVKFNLDFTPNYCDKIFHVRNTPFPIRFPHGKNSISLDRKQFSGFVNCCQDDLVPLKNWFVPVAPIQFNYEFDSTRVRILKSPGQQEIRFGYRFENSRHKSDTGFAVLRY